MKLYYIYVIFTLLLSCGKQNEKLGNALRLAGENRRELEQVLQHYSQDKSDSLKFKAALFLIENMPGHYTLGGGLINSYRKKINADSINSYMRKKILNITMGQFLTQQTSSRMEDVEHIKAAFLIRHIDASFELLEKCFWLKDIPFEVFLEYLLPYRFENESLDLWRDSLPIPPNILNDISLEDDSKHSISTVSSELDFSEHLYKHNANLTLELFQQNIEADCYYIYQKEVFGKRVVGLPATLDFIPFYPNRNGYHYWCTLITPEAKNFNIANALNRKAAKIYRRTYSQNPTIIPLDKEYVPEICQYPFNKDVTDLYLFTEDISIRANKQQRDKPYHVYLSVFTNLHWQPICGTRLKKGIAIFKNMGKDIVYLPVYYKGKKMNAFNYPFILNLKGEIIYLTPDTSAKQKLHFIRKYPSNRSLNSLCKYLAKTSIIADKKPDFTKADTICKMESLDHFYFSQEISNPKPFRYYKLNNNKNTIYIAELMLFGPDGQALKGNTSTYYQNGFDGDLLTSTSVTYPGREIIIDFGKPVEISKIVCIPRTDGNGIYPDNEYELLYYDLNGWCSLGQKIATDYSIDYDNVPSGALYWLRNLTTGVEERIFTHENGEIRFW